MNPFKNQLAPDFEASTQLPEWVPIGESQDAPDVSPFVSALKKKMMKPPDMGGAGTAMSSAVSGGASGGMKSL